MGFADLKGTNVEEIESERSEYKPLEPGVYPVRIVALEDKENNAGTGNYLKLQVRIEGDKGKGRIVFDNITYLHKSSPQAVEIGLNKIGEMTRACGFAAVEDSSIYIGKVVNAKLGVKPAREYNGKTYPAENNIIAFSKYNGPDVELPEDDDVPF